MRKYVRNRGAVLLQRISATQEEIAADTGVNRVRICDYLLGKRKPGIARRSLFREKYGIPESAWDQLPSAECTLSTAQPAAPLPSSVEANPVHSRALRLQQMVDVLLEKVMSDSDATPLEKAKVMASAAATTSLLGKLTGESSQISEARVMLLPAWRRIKAAMLKALEPWPEAMRAVGEALKGLGA